jgi:hypothetical protein
MFVLFMVFQCGICFGKNSYSQATYLTLNINNKTVKEVFSEIEKNSEYIFFYYDGILDLDRKVSLNLENENIYDILETLFKDTNNNFDISDRQIVISSKPVLASAAPHTNLSVREIQQSILVTGNVIDETGDPLIGVSVIVKGTTTGSLTGIDGSFSVTVSNSEAVLLFSFIGFITQ